MIKLINYFFPRSLTGVMASFQKTVDDLRKVAVYHATKSEAYEEDIEDLLDDLDTINAKQAAATSEANAAMILADRLSKAFGLTK